MVKRNLVFEEVDNNSSTLSKQQEKLESNSLFLTNKSVLIWLSILLLMIVCMVVVGGLTRLTDSGLSIVEWKPISGLLFPFSEEDWQVEFEKYKLIPEFVLVNSGMTIQEFKYIYLWEWGHRQLGRAIGLVWLIGFVWLATRKKIPKGWLRKFLFIGALIGTQGLIGWWMVYSGLQPGMTDVASYRLATHLGMAFCIVGLIFWFILSLRLNHGSLMVNKRNRNQKLYVFMNIYLVALFVQIILGALVAGIDAGTAYTDWPLMAGQFFPPDLFYLNPWWRNFFEDPGLVQFVHRVSGYILFIFCVYSWSSVRKSGNESLKFGFNLIFVIAFFQMVMGIVTVFYAAPWEIAIVHQFGAILLWVSVLRARFISKYPPNNTLSK